MGEFLAILALCLFSINIIVTKVASSRLNLNIGFLISMTMNVVFASLLISIQYFFSNRSFEWNTFSFLLFLLSGFFSTYLGRWLFFRTIEMLGPAKASTFQISNPLFTVIIAVIFLNETLSGFDLFAVFMLLFGLFLVSYVPKKIYEDHAAATEEVYDYEDEKVKKGLLASGILKSGIVLALFSALSYAIGNVLRGSAIREWNEPILGALIGASLGVLLHLVFNKHTKSFFSEIKDADRKGIALYGFSGILTISAQSSVIASMWYIPVSIANLITLSTPVVVTPLSYFLLKNQEGITIRTIIGIAFVLSGITLIVLL